ncbi:MAG: glycosyltransferase [Ktedonobacterales bacterium]
MQSRSKIKQEFVRSLQFLSVSFVSAVSNLLYIVALTHVSTLPFWFVSLTSTEFSMVVNFILNDRITFRNLESNRVWYVRLGRFQVAAIGGNLLTVIVSTFMHGALSLSPVYSQAIAIMLTFFVNFFVHRFWTFKGKSVTQGFPATSLVTEGSELLTEPRSRRTRVSGVSIIVPVRNEGSTMRPLLMRLHQAMSSAGLPYEVLIVDDRSEDGTAKVAAAVIEEQHLPARVLIKQGKLGKSFSLMQGFAEAHYPVLAMIDGDLELPPEALPAMVKELARYDVVVGKRVGYSKNNSLRSQLSSIFNGFILRLFLGIDFEVQTGIKVFWRYVYESMDLTPGQWGFDMEFVAKVIAYGFRIGEFEVPFQKRQTGHSKVNPLAVAVELLSSALRIKFAILQDVKANATLKVRSVSRSRWHIDSRLK